MGFGGALLAMSAIQGIGQIATGYAESAEMKYNAAVAESQAKNIQIKKDIEFGQYQRKKATALSEGMSSIAVMGIMPSGSPMAALISVQRNLNLDQAIGQFSIQQDINYKMAESEQFKRRSKLARYSGYTNAFSSLLSGVSSYGMYKYGFGNKINTDAGAATATS